MNFYNNLKKTSEEWNCLSKSDVLGFFDFMTLTISLDSLTKNDFSHLENILAKDNCHNDLKNNKLSFELYENLKKIHGLSFHEYTHYIDTTSTVWGIKFLKLLNDGYMTNYVTYEARENDFYKAKKFHDEARSLKLPDYFTAITPSVDSSRPWVFNVTYGSRYDSKGNISDIPILFVSFGNQKKERFVRSPISLVALLEVSAMAQEFLYKSTLVEALPDDERHVEKAQLQREAFDIIYNKELTEYTSCAHLVANIIGYKDILKTYKICEKLVTLVLNFTDDNFDKISFSYTAKSILKIDTNKSYDQVFRKAIEYKDRGFLFYIITVLMPKQSYDNYDDITVGISAALKEMDLDFQHIIMTARREVEIQSTALMKSSFKGLSKISASALKNFDLRISSKKGLYDISSFDLPPVLLGDGEIVFPHAGTNNSLKSFDLESSYYELVTGQLWVDRFSEACS